MRRRWILLALGLSCSIIASSATAEDKPSPQAAEAKQAREKFAKLLLANAPEKKADKAGSKRRGVVVNAFGSTRVIIH